MTQDFYYTLDWNYGVTVFRSREEAEEHAKNSEYLHVFKGTFGEEFSGWIGNHTLDKPENVS